MKKLFIWLVSLYQKYISPLKKPCCRFYPSCSTYSIQAFQRFGAFKGLILTLKRFFKCNPFHPGGVDFVPDDYHLFRKK